MIRCGLFASPVRQQQMPKRSDLHSEETENEMNDLEKHRLIKTEWLSESCSLEHAYAAFTKSNISCGKCR